MATIIDRDELLSWVGGKADQVQLEPVAVAVESLIGRWFTPPADSDPWPAYIRQGAIMLAGRVYRRRNSPAGVEAMSELGPTYVQRNDPDVAMLLGLGNAARPQVG